MPVIETGYYLDPSGNLCRENCKGARMLWPEREIFPIDRMGTAKFMADSEKKAWMQNAIAMYMLDDVGYEVVDTLGDHGALKKLKREAAGMRDQIRMSRSTREECQALLESRFIKDVVFGGRLQNDEIGKMRKVEVVLTVHKEFPRRDSDPARQLLFVRPEFTPAFENLLKTRFGDIHGQKIINFGLEINWQAEDQEKILEVRQGGITYSEADMYPRSTVFVMDKSLRYRRWEDWMMKDPLLRELLA